MHASFDAAPFPVQAIQSLRQFERLSRVIGKQAGDAQRHVIQPARRIEPGADGKPQIPCRGPLEAATGNLHQRGDAGASLAAANTAQAVADQRAVEIIQLNHVSHGAERHQVKQTGKVGFFLIRKCTAFAHDCPQGEHDVENDPHAGQVFTRKLAARLIGIDDRCRLRERFTGQMVVSDQHGHAKAIGFFYTRHAGDAIIDGDQDVRPGLSRQPHNFRS